MLTSGVLIVDSEHLKMLSSAVIVDFSMNAHPGSRKAFRNSSCMLRHPQEKRWINSQHCTRIPSGWFQCKQRRHSANKRFPVQLMINSKVAFWETIRDHSARRAFLSQHSTCLCKISRSLLRTTLFAKWSPENRSATKKKAGANSNLNKAPLVSRETLWNRIWKQFALLNTRDDHQPRDNLQAQLVNECFKPCKCEIRLPMLWVGTSTLETRVNGIIWTWKQQLRRSKNLPELLVSKRSVWCHRNHSWTPCSSSKARINLEKPPCCAQRRLNSLPKSHENTFCHDEQLGRWGSSLQATSAWIKL